MGRFSLCLHVFACVCMLTRVNGKAPAKVNERSTLVLPVYGSVLSHSTAAASLISFIIGVVFLYRTPKGLKLPAVMSQNGLMRP